MRGRSIQESVRACSSRHAGCQSDRRWRDERRSLNSRSSEGIVPPALYLSDGANAVALSNLAVAASSCSDSVRSGFQKDGLRRCHGWASARFISPVQGHRLTHQFSTRHAKARNQSRRSVSDGFHKSNSLHGHQTMRSVGNAGQVIQGTSRV